MQINELRGLCRCGKCNGLKLIGLTLTVNNEADVETLEKIKASLIEEAARQGKTVIEQGVSDLPEIIQAKLEKARGAHLN